MDACLGAGITFGAGSQGRFLGVDDSKMEPSRRKGSHTEIWEECSRLRKQWCLGWVSARPGVRAGAHRNEGASDLGRGRVDERLVEPGGLGKKFVCSSVL